MPRDRRTSDVFVGREEELRKLTSALSAAEEGDGRIVMLSGEPGIGKTRTAEVIVEDARGREFLVVNARCHEGEGAPLYWPWIQIIRSVLHDCEQDQLSEITESFGSVISEMDAQIRRYLSDPPPAPIIEDPISARFRDSVTTFLTNVVDEKPMLIILDDLHWADRSSLLLLEFFVHHGLPAPVLLLGTYLLVDSGKIEQGRPAIYNTIRRIPEGIREAIGRRLNQLSKECNEVLSIAAVVGREFDLTVISRIHDSETGVFELIEPALAARIVEECDEPDRYQFNHALTQRTLIEELSTTRRISLHAAVAEALVDEYGSFAEEHTIEFAEHYYQARGVSDPNNVARYLGAAGDQALARYADEDAASYFERALAVAGEDIGDEARARLHHGLSRTYKAMNDGGARDHLRFAIECYESCGEKEKAAGLAGDPHHAVRGKSVLDLFERALLLANEESVVRARILANLAYERAIQYGESDLVEREFGEAMEIATIDSNVSLQMRIEAIKGLVYMRKWDIAKQLDQSRKVMNLARTCRDLRSETVAAATAANACLRLGATNDGLEHLSRLLDLAERLRDKLLIFYGFKLKTIYCTALAMWNDAKAFYDRLAELSPVPSPVDIARHACMEADLGHDDEARRLFFEAMNVDETSYGAVHCAEILIRTGDKSYLELAKKHLRIVEDNLGLDILGASAETRRFCHAAAIVAYFERDVAAANGVFDRMKSIPVSPQPWGGGVLEYVYLTHGKFTKAIGLFDRSIAKCRESRFVVREGWDRFFRAEAFVRRDKPGDLETAIKDLGDLVEHCRRHGLVLLESRIEGLLSSASGNRHAGAAKPGISHPDGLTNREIEVLALVAGGNTNKKIAEALFISSKTVGNHVQKILEKTGSSNRAEAAVYGVKHAIE